MGHLGEHMRGGGRDHNYIGPLRLRDVFDLALVIQAGRDLPVFAPHVRDDLACPVSDEKVSGFE